MKIFTKYLASVLFFTTLFSGNVLGQRSLMDCSWTTGDFPFVTEDSYLKYSWSAGLYMPSQLGGEQTMTKFKLRVNNSNSGNFSYSNVHVYVRHTDLVQYPDANHPYPYTNTYTGFTKVFEGTVNYNGAGVYTFNFGGTGAASSFYYNGTQNLEVLIENRGGNQPYNSPWFSRTDLTSSTLYIGKRGGDDDSWESCKTSYASRFDFNTAIQFNLDGDICIYPLPIELTSFIGKANSRGNLLTWSTASETNNSYFTLLSSTDGISWKEETKINGAGTAKGVSNYEYLDRHVEGEVVYYKLSQTDYNGDSEEFDIISVVRNSGEEIGLYPNPSSGDFTLSYYSKSKQDIDIKVFDNLGKPVYNSSSKLNRGSNQIDISLEKVKSGIYFVRTIVDNEQINQKIVIR